MSFPEPRRLSLVSLLALVGIASGASLHVAATAPAYPRTPDDPYFAQQWALARIEAPAAWQESDATGAGVEIAIVDSGIGLHHEDFGCAHKIEVLPGSNLGSKRAPDNPHDKGGHGTLVAGIAAACTDNGTGIAGVAPDATLVPVRIIDVLDYDYKWDRAMAQGIDFAVAAGAHVVNLSIGDAPPDSHLGPERFPLTEKALQRGRARGVVVAAAAGNLLQPLCEYPAASRNVICVVATDRHDLRAYYSDFPVNVDRASATPGLEPVVAAPGGQGTTCEENVVSTALLGQGPPCYPDEPYSAGHGGTSLAAPHVAGVAALLYERLGGVRSRAHADLIVDTIVATADDLYTPGWDPIVGFGRVNALEAVQAVTPP
jgi:serine protease